MPTRDRVMGTIAVWTYWRWHSGDPNPLETWVTAWTRGMRHFHILIQVCSQDYEELTKYYFFHMQKQNILPTKILETIRKYWITSTRPPFKKSRFSFHIDYEDFLFCRPSLPPLSRDTREGRPMEGRWTKIQCRCIRDWWSGDSGLWLYVRLDQDVRPEHQHEQWPHAFKLK